MMDKEMVNKHMMWKKPVMIHGYVLKQTCRACPEQYDVYAGDEQVAYLRLRHGTFRAVVPDVGGVSIYEANPNGDGAFTDKERQRYLREAILVIQSYYLNRSWEDDEDWE